MQRTPRIHREKMNEDNLKKPWKKGNSGNPNGRPKGSKNRSTIARLWLGTSQNVKNPITGEMETMTQEDLITLSQIKKAREEDTGAYRALMDSAYGSPVQQIEETQMQQIDLSDYSAEDIKEFLNKDISPDAD